LLHDASLPLSYWPHAFQTAVYLINRQPTPLLQNKSPFEVLFHQQPNYLKLRKFGCLCYPLIKPYNTCKLQPKSTPCVFIGYSPTQNAYKCIDLLTARLYVSKHVLFDETQHLVSKIHPPGHLSSTHLPNHNYQFLKPITCLVISSPAPLIPVISSPISTPPLESSTSLDAVTASSTSSPGISPSHSSSISESIDNLHHEHLTSNSHVSPASTVPLPCSASIDSIPTRNHSMTTRSMNNIFKPKQLNTVSKHSLPPSLELTCVSQAVSHPEWRAAMSSELTALMSHGTWDLIPPPKDYKPVGCKWIFRIKRKADGSVEKFKARLVAKGYNQGPGVDYKETFSPVVKPATIRTVLNIAVMNGWCLRQMDVNNAFLHGMLSETVYMLQPPGFKDLSKPDYVCRLKKAIYGLKQAPRAWYSALRSSLLQLGFQNSTADSSLFIYRHNSVICYVLVYVDDLVITGSDTQFVGHVVTALGTWFSLKDMGLLHYFLGVEVIPTHAGLFLSQHQYIRDILETQNMVGAKDISTPMSTTQSLHLLDGTTSVDSTEYRRIIAACNTSP